MSKGSGSVKKWEADMSVGLVGTRIVLHARDIRGPYVIPSSGKHRSMQAVGTENAMAWIESPRRWKAEQKG